MSEALLRSELDGLPAPKRGKVRDVYDLMYVLRTVKPGEASTVIVERNGERIEQPVTFGESTRSR